MKFSKKEVLRHMGIPASMTLEDEESVLVEQIQFLSEDEGGDPDDPQIKKRVYAEVRQLRSETGAKIIVAKIVEEELKFTEAGLAEIEDAIATGEGVCHLFKSMKENVERLAKPEKGVSKEERAARKEELALSQKVLGTITSLSPAGFPVQVPCETLLRFLVWLEDNEQEGGTSPLLSEGAKAFFAQEGTMDEQPTPFPEDHLPVRLPGCDKYPFASMVLPSGYLQLLLEGKLDADEREMILEISTMLVNSTVVFLDTHKTPTRDQQCMLVAVEQDDQSYIFNHMESKYNQDYDDAQLADVLTAFRYSVQQIQTKIFRNFAQVQGTVWARRLRKELEDGVDWKSPTVSVKDEFTAVAKRQIGFSVQEKNKNTRKPKGAALRKKKSDVSANKPAFNLK